MSFGWSAGDIATAVTVVYNLIQALDSSNGAASNYRETVSFLQDLKRTLEPLQTFTAWNVYPAYGQDIGEHVGHIKEPVERFLAAIRKYEPSLGARAQDRRHRHVVRKLQWYIFMSKRVLDLKNKIRSHMRIIDILMQRLTLDMVWTTQQKLPDTLRATFQMTLRPELMAILQECLPPLNLTLLDNYQQSRSMNRDARDSKLLELYEGLSSSVEDIKRQISDPKILQQRIEFSLRGDTPKAMQKALASVESPNLNLKGDAGCNDQSSSSIVRRACATISQDSLQQIYYLVFLYLVNFLKNLFFILSKLVQPSTALTPTLLSKYNISFLDAIGRPPRVLPYEYFRSFKVLRAFIQYEFRDLPGSAWVDQCRYLILSLTNDQVLNERNWSSTVVPGTTVAMSMLLRSRLESSLNLNEQRCPESSCSGTWIRSRTQSWATCPVCQKEVFNSVSSDVDRVIVPIANNHPESGSDSDLEPRSTTNQSIPQWSTDSHPQERIVEEKPHLDDDISMFKRVVQQFVKEPETPLPSDVGMPRVGSNPPTSSYRFLRAFCPFDPTEYRTTYENLNSDTVLLSIDELDIIMVHSFHESGWADGNVLGGLGSRGWLPTNYCEAYEPQEMTKLLRALSNLWDTVRDKPTRAMRFSAFDSRTEFMAGVRHLLEQTNCLSREAAIIQQHEQLRRWRKMLLWELSMFAKTCKRFEQVAGIPALISDIVEDTLDEIITYSFRVVNLGAQFLLKLEDDVIKDDVIKGDAIKGDAIKGDVIKDERLRALIRRATRLASMMPRGNET